ncbi:DUF3757 domain-containing protein [Paraburkholderia mimosarum]|uniref:DUF3757 domain-containing protein n=1 Tax=Paraburkholderia mimosarum TaxID=312026 RepID=UPI00056BD43F|nr:DUF3757 domain-containing protein [Paraburkholderia mimosarum]
MMKSVLIFSLALCVSSCALAETVVACPTPADITMARGVYTANASDGNGEWLGIAQGLEESTIKAFFSAIFFPAHMMDSGSAASVKCSYELNNGNYVDLRFIAKSQKPKSLQPDLRLEGSIWHQKNGPFDLFYYECTAPSGSSCRFVVVQRS